MYLQKLRATDNVLIEHLKKEIKELEDRLKIMRELLNNSINIVQEKCIHKNMVNDVNCNFYCINCGQDFS